MSRAYYRFLRAAKSWEGPRTAGRQAEMLAVRERILAAHDAADRSAGTTADRTDPVEVG